MDLFENYPIRIHFLNESMLDLDAISFKNLTGLKFYIEITLFAGSQPFLPSSHLTYNHSNTTAIRVTT